ncbi:hypothetical protein U5922_010095 [Aquicoccus sp. G2-2]|uniref:hypothetical protein n=1 Tax=Aquicoccus sp. G2-2 TaxID=3092120 RepID=UPI002AE0386F|nr:hypothetical protein [Aquicoccus sp. G2-2]MEA1113807.1 hypothetical protein [Aquicoccus sp. G2-2]
MSDLDARLLAAHSRDDRAALVTLYEEAADAAVSDVACGFYLTHAFIFALEVGDAGAERLRGRLKGMGRV